MLNLTGGNDGLSLLVPYTDPAYYSRRPTLAIPAGQVLQVGSDASGKALGLHPKLTGLREIFNQGRLAIIQRAGYENSSRSHFSGTDIWSTANPPNTQGAGWIGRYLSTLNPPLDPLAAWTSTTDTPHALQASGISAASVPSVAGYGFSSPNTGNEAALERAAAARIASHVPIDQPHVAFVGSTVQAAMASIARVATVATYRPSVTYPNNGFGQALQAVAGAMSEGLGRRCFRQTGGFDTHASQDTISGQGVCQADDDAQRRADGLYDDLKNTRLIGNTLLLSFSEFGRRDHRKRQQGPITARPARCWRWADSSVAGSTVRRLAQRRPRQFNARK